MPMMKKKPTPVAPDPYSPNAKMVQPFMPGQQGLLAQQLSAGGYGTVDQNMGLLDQWTSPMKLPGKFNYGNPYNPQGATKGDLSKEQMQIAQPWVRTQGNFDRMDQRLQFQQLDPQIQEWLRAQWGGGQ